MADILFWGLLALFSLVGLFRIRMGMHMHQADIAARKKGLRRAFLILLVFLLCFAAVFTIITYNLIDMENISIQEILRRIKEGKAK